MSAVEVPWDLMVLAHERTVRQRHMRDLDGSLAYLEHEATVTALHEAEAEVRRLEALVAALAVVQDARGAVSS